MKLMDSFDAEQAIHSLPKFRNFPSNANDLRTLKSAYENYKLNLIHTYEAVIELPLRITLQNAKKSEYVLMKELGKGAFGRAFEALQKGASKPVVIKVAHSRIPHAGDYMRREADVLQELGRTYEYDPKTQILVQEKIEGITLVEFLQTDGWQKTWDSFNLENQYFDLPMKFYRSTNGKYIHGDIRPANVILQPNGELTLIDFDLSYFAYPPQSRELQQQLFNDLQKAENELELDFAGISWKKSFGTNDLFKIQKKWMNYIHALERSGRKESASDESLKLAQWLKENRI
jgi:serine/threonine protein kinase